MRDKKKFDKNIFDYRFDQTKKRLNSLQESRRYMPLPELLIMTYVQVYSFDEVKAVFKECVEYGCIYKATQENYPNHKYFKSEIWVLLAFGFGLNINELLWDKLSLELLTPSGVEWLMDTIIAQKYPNRMIGELDPWKRTPTGKRFGFLSDYIQSNGNSQFALKHLKKWHSNQNKGHFRKMVGYGALATDPAVRYEAYSGQFAFELAAVVMAFNFDDSEFREDIYYPKELVDHWRKNK